MRKKKTMKKKEKWEGGGGDVDEEDCEIHDATDANRDLGLHWVFESNEPTNSEDTGDSFFLLFF